MTDIIVDTREATNKTILKGLQKFLDVEIQNLGQCVDYALPSKDGTMYLIQRKRAPEMMNKNSVFEDMIGMKMMEDSKYYLLIEGTLSIIQKFSKMREEPIIGIVQSVLDDYDVKVIPSPNQYWTIKWLVQLSKRLGRTKEKTPRALGYSVDLSLPIHEQARQVLESLPNISVTLSHRIFEEYRTLKNAFANVEDWQHKIKGIGEEKTRRIIEILNTEWVTEEP